MFFVGGTALRFFYNLPRFSEDLDFNTPFIEENKFEIILEHVERNLSLEGFSPRVSYKTRYNLHIGENYTWVLPLKDCFASSNGFYLPDKTVHDKPWADMVVNTMAEGDYTRLNVSIIPRKPSVSVEPSILGKIIDFSYPSEFEVALFFPDYRIDFYGDLEDLNQGQSYNFTILVDELKEVELWVAKTHGGDTEYSETLTFPVSELGSVTVADDVPVKWEYRSTYPKCAQSITIVFE